MGSVVVAIAGCYMAVVLSIVWLCLLFADVTWFWTENGLFSVSTGLYTLTVGKGTAGTVSSFAVSVFSSRHAARMDKFLVQDLWLQDGVQHMCAPAWEAVYHWCESWKLLHFASISMLFLGTCAAVCLALAGCMGYYYNAHHATRTGRICNLALLIAAPSCSVLGLMVYVCVAVQTGMGTSVVLKETTYMFGAGLFMDTIMTLGSGVPLFLQVMYGKRFKDEKHGEYDKLAGLEACGHGQPGAQGGYGGYGGHGGHGGNGGYSDASTSAGPSSYGSYGTCSAPQSAGYGAPPPPPPMQQRPPTQQTQYPAPGSGVPAW